jgi:hypothetical protein
MTVTTPVSTIGIRGTTVLIDSGVRVNRVGGRFVVTARSQTGEVVTLGISRDGTVGIVTVANRQTGQSTTLRQFGETVTTQTVNGGATQLKSTLLPEEIKTKFGVLLLLLQGATGKDLADPANLQDALQDLLDFIELEASPD